MVCMAREREQIMQHSVNCRNGIRKVHSHRLEGSADLNTKAPRLQPVPVARALTSFRHLASGFYSTTDAVHDHNEAPSKKRQTMAILLISVSNQTWGMELHMAAGDNGFIIPLQASRQDSLQPLKVCLPKCLHRNVSIFKMEMQIAEQTTFLQGSCEKMTLMPQAGKRASAAMREDEASETDSTASAHSAHSKHSRASKGSGITDLSSVEEVVECDSDSSSIAGPGV